MATSLLLSPMIQHHLPAFTDAYVLECRTSEHRRYPVVACVLGRHREAGWPMHKYHGAGEFVHALAAGTARAGNRLLEFLGSQPELSHSIRRIWIRGEHA